MSDMMASFPINAHNSSMIKENGKLSQDFRKTALTGDLYNNNIVNADHTPSDGQFFGLPAFHVKHVRSFSAS